MSGFRAMTSAREHENDYILEHPRIKQLLG
jgi:hypothetical protein